MPDTETRYVAFPTGAGNAAARHAGQYITPAPRSYRSPEHAQLANPLGKLYVCTLNTVGDTLTVEAVADFYPVTLYETRVPGYGAQAEGAVVLRDFGPKVDDRWVTHFRNDQSGGYHGGRYCSNYADAVGDFAEASARELRSALLRAATLTPAEAD